MANESSDIYKSLDPKRNEIRILRLKSRRYNRDNQHDEQQIICLLEHRTLDDDVEYMALSYVWENGLDRQEILLSSRRHSISANLVDALRQLRNDSDDVILWVDQLCINQDDYAEKASQIQKMASIYKRAIRVISWLGVSADESDLVLNTLRQIDKSYARSSKRALSGGTSDRYQKVDQATPNHADQIFEATKVLNTLGTALPAFAARSYWTRLWVLQEFALASSVLLMCGSETITDVSFGNAWELLGSAANGHEGIVARGNSPISDLVAIAEIWRRDPQWWDAWLGIKRFVSQRDDYYSRRPEQNAHNRRLHTMFITMYTTLTTFSGQIQLLCSDPRDRIFSLLGLVGDSEEFSHFPDYTKSTESIYEDLARNFIQQGHIDALSFIQEDPTSKARDMASWAADWSLKIRIPVWGKLPFNASLGWKVDLTSSVQDNKTMVVSGAFVDTIQSRGSRWAHAWPMTPRQMHIFLRELAEFCDRSDLIPASKKESACAMMAAPTEMAYLRNKEQMLTKYRAVRRQVGDSGDLPAESDPELHAQYSSHYEREVRNQMFRCSFITSDGHVGIAPPYIQEGDCICIFPGARTPYILRPQSKSNTFTVVGAAHIFGLMNGEYFEKKRKIQPFALV